MGKKTLSVWLPIILCAFVVAAANAQYDRGQSGGDYGLPVTLLSFSATSGENSVILSWETVSEIDLLGFNLYRSLEWDQNYSRINSNLIPAQGTGPEFHEYQYIDHNVSSGLQYHYKLATVTLSGSEEIIGSMVSGKSVELPRTSNLVLIGNFPEPFNMQTRIAFTVYESSHVLLQVYDIKGRRVSTLLDRVLPPGEYTEPFGGEQLPSGIYLCRLQDDKSYDAIKKMVLLR